MQAARRKVECFSTPQEGNERETSIEKPLPPRTLLIFTMAKSHARTEADDLSALSFEAAIQRLEGIVERMEAGDVPLAELLQRYEEGARLLTQCEGRLKSAELKIEQLKRRKDAPPVTEPFALGDSPVA